jgi:hypothetical protein
MHGKSISETIYKSRTLKNNGNFGLIISLIHHLLTEKSKRRQEIKVYSSITMTKFTAAKMMNAYVDSIS